MSGKQKEKETGMEESLQSDISSVAGYIRTNFISIMFLLLGSFLFLIFTVFYRFESYYNSLVILSAFVGFGPTLIVGYLNFQRVSETEKRFPEFLRDLAKNMKSGMALPDSMYNVSKKEYGQLSLEVKKLSVHISWGMPFHEGFLKMGDRMGSKILDRSISIIVGAYQYGGQIANLLESVSDDVEEMKIMEDDRRSRMFTSTLSLYGVYIIFLGLAFVLLLQLFPSFTTMSESMLFGKTSIGHPVQIYWEFFYYLSFILAISTGFVLGQMAYGSPTAGLPHCFVLMLIGYSAFNFISPPLPMLQVRDMAMNCPPMFPCSIFVSKTTSVEVVYEISNPTPHDPESSNLFVTLPPGWVYLDSKDGDYRKEANQIIWSTQVKSKDKKIVSARVFSSKDAGSYGFEASLDYTYLFKNETIPLTTPATFVYVVE